jgi:bifunctional enzyme CysN/CysC
VPAGKTSKVARIVTLDGDLEAVAGQSVTLTFEDEIDCSRGDVIAAADAPRGGRPVRGQHRVDGDDALIPGRAYWLKIGTQTVSATVQAPNTPSTSTRWSIAPPNAGAERHRRGRGVHRPRDHL